MNCSKYSPTLAVLIVDISGNSLLPNTVQITKNIKLILKYQLLLVQILFLILIWKQNASDFEVLLKVHLSLILTIDQLNAQILVL
jgi:hypothetical protein